MSSLAASFSGLSSEAIQLANGYAQGAPPAPDVVATLRPILEAGVALITNDGKTAIETLGKADPFASASAPWVPYLRGLAYEAIHDTDQAIVQFRAVEADLAPQPISVIHPLARLRLARLLRAMNDDAGAREQYTQLAAAWKNGDTGHQLVAAALREASAAGKEP
jgi:hypothetical protein